MPPTEPGPVSQAGIGREERDVETSAVVWFGIWLFVGCVLAAVAVLGRLPGLRGAGEGRAARPVPAPRIEPETNAGRTAARAPAARAQARAARRRGRAALDVRVGRPQGGHRADPDRPRDDARRRARRSRRDAASGANSGARAGAGRRRRGAPMRVVAGLAMAAALALRALPAAAQTASLPPKTAASAPKIATAIAPATTPASASPALDQRPAILRQVGIDAAARREPAARRGLQGREGRAVRLSPVLRQLARRSSSSPITTARCSAPQVLNGLLGSLKALSFDVGKEFEVVTVSFDPRERPADAAAKKKAYLDAYGRSGAAGGWHFLTGRPRVDRAAHGGRRLPLRAATSGPASSRTRRRSSSRRRTAACRATSTASTTRRETCGWASSRRPTGRSARPSTSSCLLLPLRPDGRDATAPS